MIDNVEVLAKLEEMLERRADQIVASFEEKLESRRSIGEVEHRMHHDYLRRRIEQVDKQDKMWTDIKKSVIGAIVVSLLIGLGGVVMKFFEWWKANG